MQGIHIAAIITTIFALGSWGIPVFWKVDRRRLFVVLTAIICQLPMCALAFYVVREPLIELAAELLGAESFANSFMGSLWAPITEEPAKLWPLILPWLWAVKEPNERLRLGLALGLGFGVGELWFLADRIADNPAMRDLPWYMFTGFIGERWQVCFFHGFFTSIVLRFRGIKMLSGYLLAMVAHYLLNFPIWFAGTGTLDLGQAWQLVFVGWIHGGFLLAAFVVAAFRFGSSLSSEKTPKFDLWMLFSGLLSFTPGLPFGVASLILVRDAKRRWEAGEEDKALGRLAVGKVFLAIAGGVGVMIGWVAITAIPALLLDPPGVPVEGDERDRLLAEIDPVVDNLLEGFNDNDYEKFSRDFDDTMKRVLNRQEFEQNMPNLMERYGKHLSSKVARLERRSGKLLLIRDGVFERREKLGIRVGLTPGRGSKTYEVSGLFFSER